MQFALFVLHFRKHLLGARVVADGEVGIQLTASAILTQERLLRQHRVEPHRQCDVQSLAEVRIEQLRPVARHQFLVVHTDDRIRILDTKIRPSSLNRLCRSAKCSKRHKNKNYKFFHMPLNFK